MKDKELNERFERIARKIDELYKKLNEIKKPSINELRDIMDIQFRLSVLEGKVSINKDYQPEEKAHLHQDGSNYTIYFGEAAESIISDKDKRIKELEAKLKEAEHAIDVHKAAAEFRIRKISELENEVEFYKRNYAYYQRKYLESNP